MAQLRYNNWQDYRISDVNNRKELGAVPDGLWRGFDYDVSSAGTNLVLSHTATGYTETLADGDTHEGVGMVKTKQGVIVTEDEAITVVVTNNAVAVHPRIDLIILQHTYVETPGGVDAGYSTVIGTPSGTPTDPIPPDPLTTIILGYLWWNAGGTTLADATYTKAPQPVAGGGDAGGADYVLKSIAQTITARKQIYSQSAIQPTMARSGTTLTGTTESNHYILDNIDSNYISISTFVTPYSGTGIIHMSLSPNQKLRFISGGNIGLTSGVPVNVEPGQTVYFYYKLGAYYLIGGNEVKTNTPTKMLTGVVGNKQTATYAANKLTLNGSANYYEVAIDFSTSPVINLVTGNSAKWDGTNAITKGGNYILVKVTNSGGVGTCILNVSGTLSGDGKPLTFSDYTSGTFILDGGYFIAVENENDYTIVSVFDNNVSNVVLGNRITTLSTTLAAQVALGTWTTLPLGVDWTAGAQIPQYRVDGMGRVYLRGFATSTTSGSNITFGTLPAPARPTQDMVIPCFYNNGTSTQTTTYVNVIAATGIVSLTLISSGNKISLDGIVFLNS